MRRKRYFQWLDGELKDTVTSLIDITEVDGEYFYNFEDGESCNVRYISPMTSNGKSLREKFMVEVENPSKRWTTKTISSRSYRMEDGSEQVVEIPPFADAIKASGQECSIAESAVGKTIYEAPIGQNILYKDLPDLISYLRSDDNVNSNEPVQRVQHTEVYEPVRESLPVPQPQQISVPEETVKKEVVVHNPVQILVDKCKKHTTDIDMTISIDLPSKSIFDIAMSEFDDGAEMFVETILSSVKWEDIRNSLKTALVSAYINGETD